MGKYDPLKDFLESQGTERVPVKFAELESILGFPLPASKQYPAWWSNSPTNNPMTKVWLRAGYKTEQVDTSGERLVFSRVKSRRPDRDATGSVRSGPFPGYGAMAGTARISFGVDLTEPADASWGAGVQQE
jgi:hypothetical protein